ncbi:30S ribosomal protein S12 methylthiotransferase RimO [Pelagibaculum spongiae]|uniref:30S ribosomal protein S12 methylthiotransferase RimO n=1 Tax=Pelagibaculum spongiae TaxID=2080658 RepID=A0A2V1GUF2_9GAMM|nr:30S ribosomal protein S12 methylthiotransferase RimO [Pelagibaculum spongiae]PVZ67670.1 30S ribosomal protein S12 methylthiotransferase RimO [Pelagibaculum spongiae]
MNKSSPKVGFVSLGCPKALVDSERILSQLARDGYQLSDNYQDADVVVVNTCGYIDQAQQESLDTIGEAIQQNGQVIVTGCMGSGSLAEKIRQAHPQVLDIQAAHSIEKTVESVHQQAPISAAQQLASAQVPTQGIKLTPHHYGYLKISEGCDHHCSFSILPSLRGKLISRPSGSVLEEAERLMNAGTGELLVIAHDTSVYGKDRNYLIDYWNGRKIATRLKDLLENLGSMGIWIRLQDAYLAPELDALIPLMADGTILPYLDLQLQHVSPAILGAMQAPASNENALERIQSWRETCSDIALKAHFMVGFPGETEADFEMLLDFLKQAQLDHIGCQAYCAVDGAAANQLSSNVSEQIKQQRLERLIELQQQISAEKLQQRIGKRYQILVDGESDNGEIYGRSFVEAPDTDSVIWLENGQGLQPGDLVDVEIYDADEYDLYARPAED